MKDFFKTQSAGLIEVLAHSLTHNDEFFTALDEVVTCLKTAFEQGHRLYTAGNGGSAAEAQHLAEEFIGRYHSNRKSYPAISLTADGTAMTCIANDFGFEEVFKRQLEGLGQKGDVLVVLSTSGNSENLVRAATYAKEIGMTVIAFLGKQGKLKELADIAVCVPSAHNARVQELHLHAIHLICEAFEK